MAPPDTTTTTTTTIHRLTQATALLLSSLAAGVNLSLSTFLVPRLLESPTPLMLQQWRRTYARGAATIPFVALAAGAGYLWLGLQTRGLGLAMLGRSRLYLLAAGLTVGIAPYTVLVMQVTNGRLKGLEAKVGVRKEEGEEDEAVTAVEVQEEEEEEVVTVEEERTAKGLVDWWGVLNLGRAGLLVGGVVCGLAATL